MSTPHPVGPGLGWQHFPAGPNGFFRAPVLLTGPNEALLIDGGFSFSDGRALAKAIAATGKDLTTVYISQSDPDYYFGLKPVCDAFPNASVLAASDTLSAIDASIERKLAVWAPQLGENGPQSLSDIVMPKAFDAPTIAIDGQAVEIVPAEGLAKRRYLRVPSLNALFGGVLVFAGVHVWTADTPTKEGRAAWIENLDRMAATNPSVVVPGHLVAGASTDLSGIVHTRDYLVAFEEELAKVSDAASLIAAMQARFPGLDMGVALDVGSKVATGEMKWG